MATNALSLQEIQGFRGFLGFLDVQEGLDEALLGHVDAIEVNRQLALHEHDSNGNPYEHVTEVVHEWVLCDRHAPDCDWPQDDEFVCDCVHTELDYFITPATPDTPGALAVTRFATHPTDTPLGTLADSGTLRDDTGDTVAEAGPMLVYDPMAPLGPNCGTCGTALPASKKAI